MSIKADKIAPILRGLAFNGKNSPRITFSEKESADSSAVVIDIPETAEEKAVIRKAEAALAEDSPGIVNVPGTGSFYFGPSERIAVVTGGAQGFGAGIVRKLSENGYYVFIADMNLEGAGRFAAELNREYSRETAAAVEVNVTDEASVEKMVSEIVLRAGGLDLLVNNAGVLKAGSVKVLDLNDFEFVTKVNYTGYFLCVKYVSRVMALQNKASEAVGSAYFTDIIQINSKSGLEGSNKNSAYAGGKFGGIGLTQSFALELVTDNIKVNSICPGNFFEGPLWSDPQRGLFIQYLKTGKVPGAKTIEDVKAFYEAKVPMGRGCTPDDIAKALFYLVEQTYETGQALPVTGGQVMLK
jgi:sorbitol-6-phosphate 2-dehydrogenase